MIKYLLTIAILAGLLPGNLLAQSLEDYIRSGLKSSPLLYDIKNQKLAGKLDSLLLIAAYKPQINQISQVSYPPTGPGWGYDESITNGGNYSSVVNITKPLFIKKQISGQLQSLALISQGLKVNESITLIDLKKSITAQYITAFNDYGQNQFNHSLLDLLNDEVKTVKTLVDKGVYQLTDLMNLQVLIGAQKIMISQSYIQLTNDIALLNFICGISDPSEPRLIKPEISVRNDFSPESSPLFVQFRIDSLKNINSRHLIDLNYRPKIGIFADAGFNAIVPENIPHNMGTSFGINFSVPIYDGKQRKLQYDKINLAENTRSYLQRFYTSQYKLQHDQLANQLKLTENLINEISKQLSQQERLIALYRVELEKGLVRFLDFMAVVNSYSATQNTFLGSQMNRLQIINQMNYLK